MRKQSARLFGFLLLVSLLMAFSFPAKVPVPIEPPAKTPLASCASENSTFVDGEEVTYKLFYNWKIVWIAAGEVTFRVKDLGDQYYLSALGRTYKSYDPFFKVRDTYECYIDKETLLPTVAIRKVEEGKYRLYDKVTFDRKNNKAKSLRGKSEEVAKITEYPINDCIHDLLSIVYFARNIDFDNMNPGEKIPVDLFMDKETWPLSVTYRGKQEKTRIK
ncbi:MAG: DUF3108 domain-containing protein, partial [Bacteroidota bacterium]